MDGVLLALKSAMDDSVHQTCLETSEQTGLLKCPCLIIRKYHKMSFRWSSPNITKSARYERCRVHATNGVSYIKTDKQKTCDEEGASHDAHVLHSTLQLQTRNRHLKHPLWPRSCHCRGPPRNASAPKPCRPVACPSHVPCPHHCWQQHRASVS